MTTSAVKADPLSVLPTDELPTHNSHVRKINTMQFRIMEKLPSSLYLNSSVEGTFRIETNPFQYPSKHDILRQELPGATQFADLDSSDQQVVLQQLARVNAFDNVQRINPNFTVGWSPTGNTQLFCNYFFLRDSLVRHSSLNSNTHSIGFGAQHTFPFGDKFSLQPQVTIRELFQTDQPDVLDYLPAVTAQYQFTPSLVGYVNSLLQIRQLHFASGPGREIDPFHTVGLLWNKGLWTLSASGTFFQGFREPFKRNALIPVNGYSIICDYEIDRQLFKEIPGLVALVRAEPVYNFHSNATPSLSGVDFRLYYGLRFSASKPALTGQIQELKKEYGQKSDVNRIREDVAAQEGKHLAALE